MGEGVQKEGRLETRDGKMKSVCVCVADGE